jgi:hypothetical protein
MAHEFIPYSGTVYAKNTWINDNFFWQRDYRQPIKITGRTDSKEQRNAKDNGKISRDFCALQFATVQPGKGRWWTG